MRVEHVLCSGEAARMHSSLLAVVISIKIACDGRFMNRDVQNISNKIFPPNAQKYFIPNKPFT